MRSAQGSARVVFSAPTAPLVPPLRYFVDMVTNYPSGCIVSMMAVITTVACNKSEEDVAVIIGLIGAVLGELTTSYTMCLIVFSARDVHISISAWVFYPVALN